ncbi:hypothetical protein F5Y10DRAFT_220483 [Nemania abortiva]|nr:hypothetical protein F5Y10DRAFT_220483 [Nemania abortiva]
MTDQVSGSSLPQARDLGRQQQQQEREQEHEQRRHTHLHFRNVDSSHHHNHNHQHLHHARSRRDGELDERETSNDNADNTSDVVVIVETISVLQVTGLDGSTITQTLVPNSATTTPVITGSQSESTVASYSEQDSPTDPLGATSNSGASGDGNGVADSSSLSVESSTVTSSGSSMPISFPTLSYAPITSTPLSVTPVFPSLSGLHNSTLLSSAFGNSSASLHSFTTASERNFSAFGGAASTRSKSTHNPSSTFTHSDFETSTSESLSSATSFTSTVEPSVTAANGGNGIGSTPDASSDDGSASTSAPSSDSGNTSAATIAGSVVGAISGLAIILLLAAVFFRWKKRQSSMKLLQESGNDRGHGAITARGSGGPGDGAAAMSQRRRSIPFAIPAALANLSGHSRFSRGAVSSDGGERGFAKISGRKLPPVLQFGGDGYSDPRATMMSDQSIDYRASQNFFGEAPLSRLAVGSPMLQETGVPVFHASPARTATATPGPFSNPFSDDNVIESPTLPPTLPPDSVGSLRLSHDRPTGSRGSFSRFTENL